MQLLVGAKLKDKRRAAWLASLSPRLHPGEQMLALVPNNLLRPLCDGLAVTNARILAFYGREVEHNGPKLEVSASDLVRVEINLRRGSCYLLAHREREGELVLASVHKQDATMVRQVAEQLVKTEAQAAVVTQARMTEIEPLTEHISRSHQSSLVDELSKLAFLHRQGVLTEVEFAAAKEAAINRQRPT